MSRTSKKTKPKPAAHPTTDAERCRLVLTAGPATLARLTVAGPERAAQALAAILAAGDVASLILSPSDIGGSMAEAGFQDAVAPLVPAAQALGVAVIVETESRVAGRVGADGIQLGQDPDALRDAMERHGRAMMVGAGNVRSRHTALVLGEAGPDYVMFGRPGGDIRPEPHPKNLDLAAWWATMVEIPCIVCAGAEAGGVIAVANTGAEFVAVERAVFPIGTGEGEEADATISPDPSSIDAFEKAAAEAVARINALLDTDAPRFEDPTA